MIKRTTDYIIEDLGIQEQEVYDIETGNHMFLANDILVHNSNYIDLTDILLKFYDKINPDADRNTATDFIDRACKKIESDALNPLFEQIQQECNCRDNTMHMDREAIAIPFRESGYSGIWLAKKRYFIEISDMEDFRYEEPHVKKMGIYSVTSTCPEWIKPWYDQVFVDLIKTGPEEARNTVKKFKKLFYKKSVSEIATQTSVSDVFRFTDPATGLPWKGTWVDKGLDGGKERNGGVPANSKAAIHYNYLVKKLKLDKKYNLIKNGDKIRWVYLSENPYKFDVLGFFDEIPEEFNITEYVDVDRHYEKMYLKPVTDIFEACGLSISNTISLDSLF